MNARVWGGMHLRTSIEHGAELGKEIAKYVLRNNSSRSSDDVIDRRPPCAALVERRSRIPAGSIAPQATAFALYSTPASPSRWASQVTRVARCRNAVA